ncbi:predicted protein [Plenodomus lingam JN3]|uniref:Predicted protein n=2 Tax=Leptosphaeria maculans TaxID=5022 RepID=E4ZVQ8_LEPMJ|nr:predicted protein [Plenodomus lingam JN3]CBX95684.1 predicted protein [Plenodomus lingam JN3]
MTQIFVAKHGTVRAILRGKRSMVLTELWRGESAMRDEWRAILMSIDDKTVEQASRLAESMVYKLHSGLVHMVLHPVIPDNIYYENVEGSNKDRSRWETAIA